MTVGELALLYNTERKIGASVEVVKCRGWRRDDLYDRTGLVWINPSPNMRSLTEALLYPGVGLLEATNLATGRGTDTPFERVGSTLDRSGAVRGRAQCRRRPGHSVRPDLLHSQGTPARRPAVRRRADADHETGPEFDPIRLGITLAVQLRSLYPKDWQPEGLLRLLGDRAAYQDDP